MIDPWRQTGSAQAAATHVRPSRVRPVTLFLLALLVAVAWPWITRPEPELQRVQSGPPPVVEPTGDLLAAFDLARPATVRVEARCATPLGGRQVLGVGTGFFFQSDGALLTAYHVVDASGAARDCRVVYVGVDAERREYPLELVGFDAYMDLAVMRAAVDGLVPFIPLAASLPRPGTSVVAIGNSRGDFLAGRAGQVTRLGVRAGRADFADETIELTNALAPGDSGGPVVTSRGEAVGVVSYISFDPGGMRSDVPLPPFLMGLAHRLQLAAGVRLRSGDGRRRPRPAAGAHRGQRGPRRTRGPGRPAVLRRVAALRCRGQSDRFGGRGGRHRGRRWRADADLRLPAGGGPLEGDRPGR